MLAIISPAKSLDFDPQERTESSSEPTFLDDTETLVRKLRRQSAPKLSKLMGISGKLATLNRIRYAAWKRPAEPGGAKQALLAFNGDVYTGFDLDAYMEKDFRYAQDHLRILSGLYGVLRPLDLIQPHRLEMGTQLRTSRGKDLYAFWGDRITRAINEALEAQDDDILVNLASNEYFQSVNDDAIDGRIVTPVFKDYKDGKLTFISFFAKKARGMMADYILRQRVRKTGDLRAFDAAGYGYDDTLSTGDTLVFTRAEN